MNDKSYRKNVGLIVLNQENQLLVCRRKDQQTWQFPQGGIDIGESPRVAAHRELFEEVGTFYDIGVESDSFLMTFCALETALKLDFSWPPGCDP